jgi:plastocyanin
MKLCLGLILALLLAGCSQNNAPPSADKRPATRIDLTKAANVNGTVTFTGTAPKRQPIDMSQDPGCGLTPKNYSEGYVIEKGKVQNVFVYLKDGLGNYIYPEALPAIIDQEHCRYVPHVIGVRVGQQLQVLNSDPALHNIHAMPRENEGWNLSQYPGGSAIEKTFDKPELMIPVQCNNHPWMKMYVNVLSHPFFAVTDADGHFAISGLPPGTYTLAALHEKMGEKTVQITVRPKESQTVDFAYDKADMK